MNLSFESILCSESKGSESFAIYSNSWTDWLTRLDGFSQSNEIQRQQKEMDEVDIYLQSIKQHVEKHRLPAMKKVLTS